MKTFFKVLIPSVFLLITLSKTGNFILAQTTNSKINSGTVIAYCYQPMEQGVHQIYMVDEDGNNNKRLINSSIGLNHPDWSPDAKKLAAVGYVNQSTWSIYSFNSDGTGLTRLTTTNNVFDSEPSWSPDGSEIAFTRIYPSQNYKNEIWTMNADGSNQHYIGVEGFAAEWSPDGSKFIFTNTGDWGPPEIRGNDIKTCNTNGTNIQQITHTTGDEWYPSWSRDGNEILFGYSNDGDYASNEIFKMNSDTTGRQQLTTNNSYDGSPRWSPDGSRICYASDIAAYQHWEVYIMENDGSNIVRVTNTSLSATAINPVWKPIDNSTSINEGEFHPKTFQLYQNYPNPFNPSTTIEYTITLQSYVELKVFDITGRDIKTLVDEYQPAGLQSVIWDGKNNLGYAVKSGIYLCQIKSGNQTQIKKMALIK